MRIHSSTRRVTRIAVPMTGLAAAAAMLTAAPAQAAPAAPAAAAEDLPTFSFTDCPALAANDDPNRSTCVNAVVTALEIKAGALEQTITGEPIRMTFGNLYDKTTKRSRAVFGKLNGQEFKVRPGIFDSEFGAVYGKPAYAGVFDQPPSPDFKIVLGQKIKLTKPFVLGLCEIGTDSNPILLNLTTGTTSPPAPNQPITGSPATLITTNGPISIYKAKHVDNSWAAPGARNCIYGNDPVSATVSLLAGLPSAAGHNSIALDEYIARVNYTNKP
ncbi:hypothetical protein [Spirillospora sp. NPDC047279]|uniref:hypothetical protein n=1 Tax=Spirillospora sp. NPDC047279 TaxID=3155478 RepID=UPI0033C2657F